MFGFRTKLCHVAFKLAWSKDKGMGWYRQ